MNITIDISTQRNLRHLKAHVKKVLKFPEDLAPLFAETMSEPTLALPQEPVEGTGRAVETIYIEKIASICETRDNTHQEHGNYAGRNLGTV